ncbi:MAG: hypothetical protein U9N59_13470 [Campylobacterota bacterium]|nr:hypothetical protein [Campylobacterota bacterium]
MYKILLKYNFIKIIPFSDTFFYTVTLSKSIKFTKELVNLNYTRHSPFKSTNIIYQTIRNKLMLWYYEDSIDSTIIVPESYLLFKELQKQKKDAIYIIDNTKFKVLVIKSGELLDSFTMEKYDDNIINLAVQQYQVVNKIDIQKDEYQNLYNHALSNLTLKELYKWQHIDLDIKTVATNIMSSISYPVSVLLLAIVLTNYFHSNSLNSEIEVLKEKYVTQRDKNINIKKDIKSYHKDIKKLNRFIDEELQFQDAISLTNNIYDIIKEDEKTIINSIGISNGRMTVRLQTNLNPIVYLNRLNDSKSLLNVVIRNTRKIKDDLKIITYTIDIQPLKETI